VLILLLVGCAPKNPNTVPTPAPIQVANSINTLAQSVDAATAALIAARDQGKISQVDLTTAFNVIKVIADVGKKLNAELRSADPWKTQKVKMLKMITVANLPELLDSLPPNARAIMMACLTLFDSIYTAVGGPTL
jgi:hypothetical protein